MIPSAADRNIVLTGFMGTGKSTVGRLLAEATGRPYVEMDARLEAAFGKPIGAVFAEEGEAAFRVAEATLCAELASERGLVISTGGGALVNPRSRAALAASGVLVCLTATPETILARLAHESHRPLLAGDPTTQRRRVLDLLHERRQAYAAIPHQVATDGLPPEQVVEAVLRAVAADAEAPGMTSIPVRHPTGAYDLLVGEGLLAHAGPLLARRGLKPGALAVVSNPVVAESCWPTLRDALEASGFTPSLCLVPEGEQHKSLATAATLYEHFAHMRLDRAGGVLALGGGVIGDLAGFAAATWMRGVAFVQAPTTLLSMVDASVGGKTGVDLPQGKNLVGAFKQPQAVIMDTATLATLPAAEFRSGLAEVVKHGIIGAPALFEALESHGPTSLTHLVIDAVRVKVDVVQEDPFEQGRRALLNLGHTFGHAIEQASGYRLRHGEAVAVGMTAAAHMAAAIGLCPPALAARIPALLERLGLPTRTATLPRAELLALMGLDKKRAGKTLRFVLPAALGDCRLVDNPGDAYLHAALDAVLEPLPTPIPVGPP
jgi:3-dehydroquinate synthase